MSTSTSNFLAAHIEARRDSPLFVGLDGASYSYGTFIASARRLAETWRRDGLKPGDTVALVVPNGAALPCCYVACAIGGYVACPIITTQHDDVQRALLALAKPSLEVRDAPSLDSQVTAADTWSPLVDDDDERPFMVLFTSGSTGHPKAICHSLRSIVASAVTFGRLTEMSSTTRLYHVLPMGYMAGILNAFFAPFLSGATIVEGPLFSPVQILDFWSRPLSLGVDTLSLTPTIAAALTRMTRDPATIERVRTTIKQVQCTSAPLPSAIQRAFLQKFGHAPRNCYGMTEMGGPLTFQSDDDARLGNDWSIPVEGLDIAIRGDQEPGELWLRSPFMMLGYLDGDGLERPFDGDGFMDTGDLAYLSEDKLQIAGRKKDIIIRGGENVSPRRVESVVSEVTGVTDCAVIGMTHPFWGEEIVACVVADGNTVDVERTVIIHCRERLGPSERPDRVVELASLPRSPIGKLQRGILCEMLRQREVAGG